MYMIGIHMIIYIPYDSIRHSMFQGMELTEHSIFLTTCLGDYTLPITSYHFSITVVDKKNHLAYISQLHTSNFNLVTAD